MITLRAFLARRVAFALVFASPAILGAESEPLPPKSCVFDGVNYLFRRGDAVQSEFTPAGQEDLDHWTDMMAIVLNRTVQTDAGLADLAKRLLTNYESGHAVVLATRFKAHTPYGPAEHFIAVAFPDAKQTEIAFARVKLVDGFACVFVYSHREYGEGITNRVSAWLRTRGFHVEESLMAWDTFPSPKQFAAAAVKPTSTKQ
jgi:hypothetical protein